MNKFYVSISNWMHRHPKFIQIVSVLNKIISGVSIVAYPLLLVYDLIWDRGMLLRAILVPMIGFVVLSVFRYLVNRKRPYEKYDIVPAIKKETKGKSFPSRHVFSAMVIGLTFLLWSPWMILGIVLILLAFFLAGIRVITGVHFISDVFVGMLFAVACACVGYLI